MEDSIFMIFPIIVFIIIFSVVVPLIAAVKNKQNPRRQKPSAARGYNREVDSIHRTTDAVTERRHRIDQLKSLYDAGMMEREEYEERLRSVEDDYNGGRQY